MWWLPGPSARRREVRGDGVCVGGGGAAHTHTTEPSLTHSFPTHNHTGMPTLLPHEVDALRASRAAAKEGDWVEGLQGLALE